MDPGYDHIGVSATTKDKVLFEGIYELPSDVVKNISSGRSGRTRELRYREPGFNNRKRESGWLPPSDKSGPDCHINIIEKLRKFLPVGKVNVEIAKFAFRKLRILILKVPSISRENS